MPSIRDIFNDKNNPVIFETNIMDNTLEFLGLDSDLSESNLVTGETSPAIEDLPQSFQDMIKSIEGADPSDKLSVIHSFTLDYMAYRIENTNDDRYSDISGIIEKNGVGDCDDYASLEMALLRYAGFDEDNIAFIGSNISYITTFNESKTDHATAMVSMDGNIYLLDMNLKEPVTINPETLMAVGKPSYEGVGTSDVVTIQINDVYTILSPSKGLYFKSLMDKIAELNVNNPENEITDTIDEPDNSNDVKPTTAPMPS